MYWETMGPENTKKTVALAVERAKDLGIDEFVVASNTGATILELLKHDVKNIVCVTHQVGFREPGEDEMALEMRDKLQEMGVKVLTTTHLFAGVGRAIRHQFGGLYPSEIVAMSLRMLGQGVKVGVEISVMALDAGLIPYGKEVIAIGGSSRGADTAIVVQPDHSASIFKSRVKEIICKPRLDD